MKENELMKMSGFFILTIVSLQNSDNKKIHFLPQGVAGKSSKKQNCPSFPKPKTPKEEILMNESW